MPEESQSLSFDEKQRTFLKKLLIAIIILIAIPYLFQFLPLVLACLLRQDLSPIGDSLELLMSRSLRLYWFFMFVLNILLLLNARRQKNRKAFLTALFLFIPLLLPVVAYIILMFTLAIGGAHAA